VKKLVAVSVMAWLCHMQSASAGVPGWCKDYSSDYRYDLKDLSSKDVGDRIITTFVGAACAPTPEVEANKADIEKARQAWGKKLGMQEADWADAVAWANVGARPSSLRDPSTKDLAKMTPVDQYIAIREGFSENGSPFSNPIYLTDMFEPNLTEVGRLASIEECIREERDEEHAVQYAICAGDIEAFDYAKFFAQLRTDTANKGEHRMQLRLLAYELPGRLKKHAEIVAKIGKKDEAYKKLWDAAKKGRAEWAASFSGNKELLALAQRLDTFQFSKSRKAREGCEAATDAALSAAITAKVPAKLFKDLKDIRMDPFAGVAKDVGPLLLDIPEIAFISGPYIQCQGGRGAAEFLSTWVDKVPGQRGPRAAAFTAITKEKIVLDDMSATVEYPRDLGHPFTQSHGSQGSSGGVIKSVKEKDGVLIVELQALLVKRKECVQSHRTNRLARINRDGSLDYELVCDKMGVKTYDESWGDFKINPAYKSTLKPGALFSAVHAKENDKGADILAVWPKKDAELPTVVLGAPVK
jgi:hypothetical protein